MTDSLSSRSRPSWLDEQEFYELCQDYRHVNQRLWQGEAKTVEAFEALKDFISAKFALSETKASRNDVIEECAQELLAQVTGPDNRRSVEYLVAVLRALKEQQ